jgi:beta-lactamase class A
MLGSRGTSERFPFSCKKSVSRSTVGGDQGSYTQTSFAVENPSMRIYLAAFALSAAILAPSVALAQESDVEVSRSILEQRAAGIVSVLRGETEAQEVFAPSFLAAVPAEQLKELLAQLETQFGPLLGVDGVTEQGQNSGIISLRFERTIARGPINLGAGPEHLVVGLLLNDFQPVNDSVAAIQADIAALAGSASVYFAPLDSTQDAALAVNADQQFAIGSTFKLYILSALARSIENGERSWSDVVTLDRKSLLSGQMQNWPDGAPVTLHTLATLMISISDNTATDMLLHEFGLEAVEAELIASGHSDPDRTLPFLSTLQMFGLKGSDGNLSKYVAADETGQRRILEDFEDDVRGNPNVITPPRFAQPTAIDTVEWFASGEDLRKLMRSLVAFEDPIARQIMAVNPALPKARREEWAYVGYKGGSEPGVLNLTWLLQDEADRWHVLVLSWNNPDAPVTSAELELLAQRILPLAF